MPNVRIVNWNIERLGPLKVGLGAGTPAALTTMMGRAIVNMAADVVLVLEVTTGTAQATMTALSAAASAESVAAGGNANDYTGWLLSYDTGGECYGALFRDLNVVRPVRVTGGPSGAGRPARGHDDDPADPNQFLNNLHRNTFATWPGTFAAMANAYAVPLPAAAARPRLPLTDIFATTPPVGRKRGRFAGQTLAAGGYAPGLGFRMPCLLMVEVLHGGGGAPHLIPIMVCHLGAVRGGANALARRQVMQYRMTHIAQKFAKFADAGYIDLNGAAEAIDELIVTGDFNIDFLQNAAVGNALQTGNRTALDTLTPTVAAGGSAAPGALPGAAGAAPMIPMVAPPGGWPDGPISNTIPDLALKAGATATPTMLVDPPVPGGAVPPPPPYARAVFDLFLFGGTQLSATYQVLGVGADACLVYDVPAQIVNGVAGGAGLNVSAAWTYYAGLPAGPLGVFPEKTQWTQWTPSLNPALGAPLPALVPLDRLVGAQFISDHLPTVLQANLP